MSKQGETRERRPSIGLNPPIGSELRKKWQLVESTIANGRPLHEHEKPEVRWAASVFALRATPVHEAPFAAVRELVVAALVKEGMATEPRPDWLEQLIDTHTHACRACSEDEASQHDHLPKASPAYRQANPTRRSKVGHPPPDIMVEGVVMAHYMATFRDMPVETSQNARFEHVAMKLSGTTPGSQIDRHFVGRMYLRFESVWPGLDEQMRKALLTAYLTLLEFLEKHERERSGGVAPESAASVRYFRT